MYVCMYAYMYVHTTTPHTHEMYGVCYQRQCSCMYTCMHVCMYTQKPLIHMECILYATYVYACMYVCVYEYMYVHTMTPHKHDMYVVCYLCVYMYVCMCI
jgi:hypothetical protein